MRVWIVVFFWEGRINAGANTRVGSHFWRLKSNLVSCILEMVGVPGRPESEYRVSKWVCENNTRHCAKRNSEKNLCQGPWLGACKYMMQRSWALDSHCCRYSVCHSLSLPNLGYTPVHGSYIKENNGGTLYTVTISRKTREPIHFQYQSCWPSSLIVHKKKCSCS